MTMENKNGDQLGDQLGDKGDKASGRHTIQQRETRRETMGDKGRQDPQEGERTIQHQGGHLKIPVCDAYGGLYPNLSRINFLGPSFFFGISFH